MTMQTKNDEFKYDDTISNRDVPDSFDVEGIALKWDPREEAWRYSGGWFQVYITHLEHSECNYEANVWVMGCRIWHEGCFENFVDARNALVDMSRHVLWSAETGLPFLDWSRQQVTWNGA